MRQGIFLAVLPVLGATIDLRGAFVEGSFIAAAYLATFVFFRVTFFWFPGKIRDTAFFLWLAALAQAAWYLASLNPIWTLSLYLLTGPFHEIPDASWTRPFMRGFGFWLLTAFLGLAQTFLGDRLRFAAFQTPAGSFLLLAAAAVLFQRPRAKAGLSHE